MKKTLIFLIVAFGIISAIQLGWQNVTGIVLLGLFTICIVQVYKKKVLKWPSFLLKFFKNLIYLIYIKQILWIKK